ncbi:MAG: hypothetical protein EXR45_04845 [Chloroflexi bacterium]|nr:hypothetical protein [Chloroflexota bacterium]
MPIKRTDDPTRPTRGVTDAGGHATEPGAELPAWWVTRPWIASFRGTGIGGVLASTQARRSGQIKTGTIEVWTIGPLGANARGVVGTCIGGRLGGRAGAFVSGMTGAFLGGFFGATAGTMRPLNLWVGALRARSGVPSCAVVCRRVPRDRCAVRGVVTGILGGIIQGLRRAVVSTVRSLFTPPGT